MIPLTVPSPIATPATTETEGFLTELGAQVEMQGGLIRNHTVRLELCLRGQTDAQRAALWHAISDVQRENQDLRLQLAEERRAQLKLAEVVDDMRKGQEPRGAHFARMCSACDWIARDRVGEYTHFLIRM
ncbi:hypothetical protein Tco_0668774 [Tanacetum coccineum]